MGDGVLRALLAAEVNRTLLIYFLNAILRADLDAPSPQWISSIRTNERVFLDDTLRLVDVTASKGHRFHAE